MLARALPSASSAESEAVGKALQFTINMMDMMKAGVTAMALPSTTVAEADVPGWLWITGFDRHYVHPSPSAVASHVAED